MYRTMSSKSMDKLDNVGNMLSTLPPAFQPSDLTHRWITRTRCHAGGRQQKLSVTRHYDLSHRPESLDVLYTLSTPTMSLEETAHLAIRKPRNGMNKPIVQTSPLDRVSLLHGPVQIYLSA